MNVYLIYVFSVFLALGQTKNQIWQKGVASITSSFEPLNGKHKITTALYLSAVTKNKNKKRWKYGQEKLKTKGGYVGPTNSRDIL